MADAGDLEALAGGVNADTVGGSSRPVSGLSRLSVITDKGKTSSRPGSGTSAASAATSAAWSWNKNNDAVSVVADDAVSSQADDEAVLINEDDFKEQEIRGCWYYFSKFVGGLWSTREMDGAKDSEVYVRTTIRELVIYCIFLTTLCITTFGMTSATQYYYSDVLSKLFAKNQEVTTVDQFWEFMEGQFLDSLYWEYNYNSGEASNFICPGGDDSVGPCPVAPSDRNVLYENRLLGVPRLRQLRVRNSSCELHEDVQRMIWDCYAEYSKSVEDVMPFNINETIKAVEHTSPSAWMYQSEDSLEGVSTTGILATYSGAGAVQDLASTKNKSTLMLKELKEGLWIGHPTRFISIDFSVYNANINLFCVIKIFFEFPATGGVIPTNDFHTVKLLRYVNPFDYFVLACELLYTCFIVYYIIEETIEIRQNGFLYFKGFWNILDLGVIAVSILNFTLTLLAVLRVEEDIGDLLGTPDSYADFSTLGFWSSIGETGLALCLFLSWVKLLKYITFNRTMVQLTKTLSRASSDLLAFGFLFMLAFMAFAQFGFFLFQSRLKDFSTITDAVFTLLRTILGDFDFRAIKNAEPFLGPAFFTLYCLYVYFILLNMFLAIINDTFTEVKAEIAAKKLAYDVGDYIKRGYNNVLGRVGARDKGIDMENALKIAAADGHITYDEVRQNLKKAGFGNLEIEMFFAKYDKNGDGIGLDNTDEIFDDLEKDELDDLDASDDDDDLAADAAGGDDSGRIVTMADLFLLSKRVDELEHAASGVTARITAVLERTEKMEKVAEEKRELLDDFFDPNRRDSELQDMVDEASGKDDEEEEGEDEDEDDDEEEEEED